MKIQDVLLNPAKRRELANQIGTSQAYLWQIATGRRKGSPTMAKRIEKATGIHRSQIRPDLWD
jgi:DNA-binding transcriptional regulator YdaS (Cro superfamily)